MRKIALFVMSLFLFSVSGMAQSEKTVKAAKEDLTKLVEELNKTCRSLEEDCGRLMEELTKRQVSTPPQQPPREVGGNESLETLLGDYVTMDDFYNNRAKIRATLQPFANQGNDIAAAYMQLNYAIMSLYEGYERSQNLDYKDLLDKYGDDILGSHKSLYEEVKKYIGRYPTTMTELVRVFKLVDTMERSKRPDDIYNSLDDDFELDFIKDVPYANKLIKKYIQAHVTNNERGKKECLNDVNMRMK